MCGSKSIGCARFNLCVKVNYLCQKSIMCGSKVNYLCAFPAKVVDANKIAQICRAKNVSRGSQVRQISRSLSFALAHSLALHLSISFSPSLPLSSSPSLYLSFSHCPSHTHSLTADQPALPARHRRKDRRIPHHPQTRCVTRVFKVKFWIFQAKF